MTKHMYSIHDLKAKIWNPPFIASNDEEAQRMVMTAMLGESQLSMYPEDFRLYVLGTYNQDTGQIEGIIPDLVCELVELKGKEKDV